MTVDYAKMMSEAERLAKLMATTRHVGPVGSNIYTLTLYEAPTQLPNGLFVTSYPPIPLWQTYLDLAWAVIQELDRQPLSAEADGEQAPVVELESPATPPESVEDSMTWFERMGLA